MPAKLILVEIKPGKRVKVRDRRTSEWREHVSDEFRVFRPVRAPIHIGDVVHFHPANSNEDYACPEDAVEIITPHYDSVLVGPADRTTNLPGWDCIRHKLK